MLVETHKNDCGREAFGVFPAAAAVPAAAALRVHVPAHPGLILHVTHHGDKAMRLRFGIGIARNDIRQVY